MDPTSLQNTSTTSQVFPTLGAEWKILSPIHVVLSIYITFQNSLVIHHYLSDWKRISSSLFILIAAADIGNALSEIGRNILEFSCTKNTTMQVQNWVSRSLILFGMFCYVISSYLYLVLTVIKTVNIVNPFYRLSKWFIYISLSAVSFMYFALYTSDNVFDVVLDGRGFQKCSVYNGLFSYLIFVATLGQITLGFIANYNAYVYQYILIFFLVIQFCVPGIIVLVCMPLQMFYIKKALSASENPALNNANHINITVFMISFLYLCSVTVFAIVSLYIHINFKTIVYWPPHIPIPLLSFGKYTLPLLNAALFPTILILRKLDLRAEFRNYIVKVLLLPLTIFHKVRSLVLRRNGYTEI